MKKKINRKLMVLILLAALMVGQFGNITYYVQAVSQETQDQIDDAEQEKKSAEDELLEKQGEKNALEEEKKLEEATLEDLQGQYDSLASEIEVLEEKKSKQEEDIAVVEDELKEVETQMNEQYEDMKMRIQYIYESENESIFYLLLSGYGISDAINKADNVKELNDYDRKKLQEYEDTKSLVKAKKEKLEQEETTLNTLMEEVADKQDEIITLQETTSDKIDDYLNVIASAEADVDDAQGVLEAKSKALKKLYDQAEAEEAAARQAQAQAAADALASGIATADSEIVQSNINVSINETELLAAIIYCESRGEPFEGQLAVGYVVMNRVRSAKFANTVEGVIRQSGQFSPVSSGRFDYLLTALREGIPGIINQNSWNSCYSAASQCVNGSSNVGESLYFRTYAPVPDLIARLESSGVPHWIIGHHVFYYAYS